MVAAVRQVKLIDTGVTQLNSPQQTAVSAFPLGNTLAGSVLIAMPTASNFVNTIVWGANDNKNGAYGSVDNTQDVGNCTFNSYYKPNSLALTGSDIIQWRFGDSNGADGNEDFVGCLLIEVTGVTATPLLAHAINSGTNGVQTVASTSTDAITTANMVCGAVPGIVIAASYNSTSDVGSAPFAPAPGTGFTDLGTSFLFGHAGEACVRVQSMRSANLGTLAATFTATTATSHNYQTLALAFAETPGTPVVGWQLPQRRILTIRH